MKLIKSSLYQVNGRVARFTGREEKIAVGEQTVIHYVFSEHGTEIRAGIEHVAKVDKEAIKAYLGR